MPKETAIAICNLDARSTGRIYVVVQDLYTPDIFHVRPQWKVKPEQIIYTSGE